MSVPPRRGLRLNALAALVLLVGAEAKEDQTHEPPPAARPVHHLPPKIIEAVSKKLPKYTPPPPAEQPARPGIAGVDDKADGILYLPDMKVSTAKPLPTSTFSMLSLKGRLDLALKKNPGLRLGPFPGLNNGIALEIQKEGREAAARSALAEEVSRLPVLGDPQAKDVVRKMRDATARPNTDWMGGGKP